MVATVKLPGPPELMSALITVAPEELLNAVIAGGAAEPNHHLPVSTHLLKEEWKDAKAVAEAVAVHREAVVQIMVEAPREMEAVEEDHRDHNKDAFDKHSRRHSPVPAALFTRNSSFCGSISSIEYTVSDTYAGVAEPQSVRGFHSFLITVCFGLA